MSKPFFARRSFTVILVTYFFMPFLLIGSIRCLRSNRNDVRDWLPPGLEKTATHRWFQQHFPLEQFVLVSWKGSSEDDPGCTLHDQRLEMLARKLEDYDPTLEDLGIGGSLSRTLTAKRLRTQREIESYGDLTTIEGIGREEAAEVAEAIKGWTSPFKKPVLTGKRLVDEMRTRYPELSEKEIYKRLEGSLIAKDHEKTCLVVVLGEVAKGNKALHRVLERIRSTAEKDCGIPRENLRMGGPPVDNVAIDVEGERTLFRLAGLSAIVGLGISWFCFRSIRLTFLVFFCAILSTGISLATVFFSGGAMRLFGYPKMAEFYGTCDAILLTMPSLVYVLAISAAIHIVNYYHDAVRQDGLEGAPDRALKIGWLPCFLAAITTAVGLWSLIASHLIPIEKFGVYSALGVIGSLGILFLFLPACLHYMPSRDYLLGGRNNREGRADDSVFLRFWRVVGSFVVRHNVAVTGCCLVVMAFFVFGVYQIKTSVKLIKLFSPEAEIIRDYAWLEEHIGPLVPMEVVVKVDNTKCRLNMVQRMRMVRDVEHAIENDLKEDVGGALSAATFTQHVGKTPRSAKARLAYNVDDSTTSRFLERHRDDFRDYLAVEGDTGVDELGIPDDLTKRLKGRSLTTLVEIDEYGDLTRISGIGEEEADLIAQAVDDWQSANGTELWRVSARVNALTDLDYSKFVDDIELIVERVVDRNYRKLTPADVARGVKPVEGVEVVYTGLVPLVYQAQHELMVGLYKSLQLAFVLIAVLMIVVLRSPSAGLLSMIPNLFPVVLIFGTMGWLGILVDVGSMMTASVALGVAVDDTIHFLTWFRRGLDAGRDRKGAVMLAYERCGTAMSQTTLIGGLGLSMFAFSTFTPTQRFGVLMLALLTAALFGDLIFLPAVLSGPAGRFFGIRSKKKKKQPSPLPDSPEQSGEETPHASANPDAAAGHAVRQDTSHRRRGIP